MTHDPREPHTPWSPWVASAWRTLGAVAFVLACLALGLEAVGLANEGDAIPPLTHLVSAYVPWPVTAAVISALVAFSVWLAWHFAGRWWRRPR